MPKEILVDMVDVDFPMTWGYRTVGKGVAQEELITEADRGELWQQILENDKIADSNWVFIGIIELHLALGQVDQFAGRGGKYIKLPPSIANPKACINQKNDGVFCF